MAQSKRKRRSGTPELSIPRSKTGAMDDSAYAALAQFRLQVRTFLAFSETAAQRAGLTPQQHQALLAIRGFALPEPASIGDVARFLLIRHHTAVGLIDRMVKLGLIKRVADPQDARRVLVKLTAKGEQKLRALSRISLEELRAASPALSRILRTFRSKAR
ncbi:MarR family winged helix-turn-helix transcriptional regulator [Bradyrhizobium sp.]|uniref:MarR family winged helix-turn-helix transcriptional regulator n=1 Tax=Bradyrhizobium sp. TaxID=376 RepID=UPI003C44AAB5